MSPSGGSPVATITNLVTQTVVSGGPPNASGDAAAATARSPFAQRGSSTELSSETITKRMQVQRTSKGNDDYYNQQDN